MVNLSIVFLAVVLLLAHYCTGVLCLVKYGNKPYHELALRAYDCGLKRSSFYYAMAVILLWPVPFIPTVVYTVYIGILAKRQREEKTN